MSEGQVTDYRLSHTASGYGSYYDDTILTGYYGRMLTDVEVPTLRRWVREEGAGEVLDFACGTGRLTQHLVELDLAVTGVDVSEEMLVRARRAAPAARYHNQDITRHPLRDVDGEPCRFDLVTAFRFFQNASPELRDEAFAAIRQLLRPHGVLILNVQANAQSPAGRAYKLRSKLKNRPINQLDHESVRRLLERHGFRPEVTAWYGHFPRVGRVAGDLSARLDRPARAISTLLHLPTRHVAQMFMIRARSEHKDASISVRSWGQT